MVELVEKLIYRTSDGKEFFEKVDADRHEFDLKRFENKAKLQEMLCKKLNMCTDQEYDSYEEDEPSEEYIRREEVIEAFNSPGEKEDLDDVAVMLLEVENEFPGTFLEIHKMLQEIRRMQ